MAREPLIILGRYIGTSEGWDQHDDLLETHYKFEPTDEVSKVLSKGDLIVNYNAGHFEYYDTDDNVTDAIDIVDTLKSLSRRTD